MVQCLRECSDEIPRLQMWCLSLRRCVTGTEPNWTTIEPPMTRAEASAARTSNRKLQEGSKTQCHFCSYTCIRVGDVTMHERMHMGKKPFVCGACQQTFAQKSNLSTHYRVHDLPESCFAQSQTMGSRKDSHGRKTLPVRHM